MQRHRQPTAERGRIGRFRDGRFLDLALGSNSWWSTNRALRNAYRLLSASLTFTAVIILTAHLHLDIYRLVDHGIQATEDG